MTLNDQVISYALDWDGRRVARKLNGANVSRHTFESSLRVAMNVNAEGVQRHYVYGSGINSPDYMILNGENFRLVKDHLGSPRLVISANTGTIDQRMDFNEWGEVLFDSNPGFQGFGFAGGLYDQDTKLVKFGARDYDPRTGRWLSKDPIGFNGGDSNLYGYVMQHPINLIDPSGLDPSLEFRNSEQMYQSFMTQIDFLENYLRMRQVNTKGADKYYHCMANCMGASRGPFGSQTARTISDAREFFDRLKGDSESACQADQQANQTGRKAGSSGQSCSQACRSQGPSGR